MNDPIVGIDLGTTNSVVAVADENGLVRVLADETGARIQPSAVSFHPSGAVIVGAEAKKRRLIDGENTVHSAKRLIGQNFDFAEVAVSIARVAYTLREGPNKQPVVVTRAGEFTIPEISALVLGHLRKVAGQALGTAVDRAVLTVPANFTDAQRGATATAGAIAGLNIPRVLNEPTAAALAYGHHSELDELVAVYDFGGGTFDVSIVKIRSDVYEVMGTAGDSFLGGDDIDDRVAEWMLKQFLAQERVDLRGDVAAMQRLRAAAEQLKIDLTDDDFSSVQVSEIAYGPGGRTLDLNAELTRAELVGHARDIVEQTFGVCEEALRLAKVTARDIQNVILVGGSTKMPYVRQRVAEFFGREPRTDVNPDEAVAMGAALHGLALWRAVGPGTTSPSAARPRSGPSATERTAQRGAHADVFPLPSDSARGAARLARIKPRRGAPPPPVPSVPRPVPPVPGFAPPPVPAAAPPPAPRPRASSVETFSGAPDAETFVGDESLGDSELDEAATVDLETAEAATIELSVPATPPAKARPVGAAKERVLGGLFDDVETVARETSGSMGARSLADDFSPTSERTRPPGMALQELADAAQNSIELDLDALGLSGDESRQSRDSEMITAIQLPPAQPGASSDNSIELDLGHLPTPGRKRVHTENMPTTVRDPGPRRGAAVPAIADVTPYSLGIGTVAGYCEELIRRNSRVPAQTMRVFSTSKDQQPSVRLLICQGESRRIDENVILGDLLLDGLTPRPRGETKIEVMFQIDSSGILRVRARDTETGLEQQASLNILGAPSSEEVAASADRLRRLIG